MNALKKTESVVIKTLRVISFLQAVSKIIVTKATNHADLRAGFLSVLAMQPYMFGLTLGFSWQILIGTIISLLVMLSVKDINRDAV